jgi:quercetin dioxygenase-like cupin family protein
MALQHAKTGEVIHLQPRGERLTAMETAAIVKTPGFEAIRLVIRAGSEIPSHAVAGHLTLHCLEGAVELGMQQGPVKLGTGDWLYLDGGEKHSIKGIEDAAVLLTIIFKA